jgi:ribosomal protein S12 methylthiotransferase accessory factor
LYCNTRNIPTENIRLSQNIVDPENRYQQIFKIQVELPADISERPPGHPALDRPLHGEESGAGGPEFVIEEVENLDADAQGLLTLKPAGAASTYIPGKDLPLEQTIANMSGLLAELGIKIEIASWRNIVPTCGRCTSAMRIRRCASPTARARPRKARWRRRWASTSSASATTISTPVRSGARTSPMRVRALPERALVQARPRCAAEGNPRCLLPGHLQPGWRAARLAPDRHQFRQRRAASARCRYVRQSDGETVYFPSNLIENLYVSNGMSAGNTWPKRRCSACRRFSNAPSSAKSSKAKSPCRTCRRTCWRNIPASPASAGRAGLPVLVKDASLGGVYPVMCVTLMNPRTGGVFASFGAHPSLEVALERSLTELLQGRSFEGLNDLPQPTFASEAVTEPNNFVEHFIDSSGIVSWRFFSAKADYEFVEWDFSGHGENSNAEEAATLFGILEDMGKEAYTAVYDQLGATACRILVPGYSEVYPVEDLIWDNTNKALLFRADVLNLHRLDDASLEAAGPPGKQRARRLRRHRHPDRHRVR